MWLKDKALLDCEKQPLCELLNSKERSPLKPELLNLIISVWRMTGLWKLCTNCVCVKRMYTSSRWLKINVISAATVVGIQKNYIELTVDAMLPLKPVRLTGSLNFSSNHFYMEPFSKINKYNKSRNLTNATINRNIGQESGRVNQVLLLWWWP